ncbi:hypothetical protein [Dactylosporangium matsuzakiense]|uniref:Uncharacterized protein n=1 Tax=Dactylosporangium matsuzakiense TaxID=53360 RepID=A0A9W6KWS3_9ACTN|nr:hypothetical protein [Dactylosporangium matsuzakiense]UWZ47826.1 hypothetical protein Dmats_16315 [Dactylosporangium matsuzakiense]GLL08677.1 hypothetical protein GCM10017581_104450 [Dactylosporangium matsuzakiense]
MQALTVGHVMGGGAYRFVATARDRGLAAVRQARRELVAVATAIAPPTTS